MDFGNRTYRQARTPMQGNQVKDLSCTCSCNPILFMFMPAPCRKHKGTDNICHCLHNKLLPKGANGKVSVIRGRARIPAGTININTMSPG